MLVKLEVNKRFEGLTIKELLKEYHVGKAYDFTLASEYARLAH